MFQSVNDYERHLFLTQPFGSAARDIFGRIEEDNELRHAEELIEAERQAYEEGKLDAPEIAELLKEIEEYKQEQEKLLKLCSASRGLRWAVEYVTRRKMSKAELLKVLTDALAKVNA